MTTHSQPADQAAYDELSYYTLSHPDPSFIHQLIVDAYAAQHADETSKPIYLAFALAGLYLHNVKNYSGKEVQRAHMRLARHKDTIPIFEERPAFRGSVTVADVLGTPAGSDRDEAIERWSAATWAAWRDSQAKLATWLTAELGD
jgi:hypothetical protein